MASGHVGIFLSSLQDMGGAIRVAVSLANRFCRDYDVTIIELTGHDRTAFVLDDRVNVVSLDSKELRLRGRIGEVREKMGQVLLARRFDVMLGIGVEETTAAVAPCRKRGVPLVFCDHGALVNQLDDKTTTLLRFICSRVCRKTVVLTSQTEQDYKRIFHLPKKRVCTISNWIPSALIESSAKSDVQSKRILWAGRLDSEKGIDHLFEIAKRVMPKHEDWVWDVYGESVLDGDGFDLGAAVAEAGLQDSVRLCGRYSDVMEVFPSYSIGTLTSYREGLPLFLLEGMAFGLPLISFDVDTGPRDLIEEGVNGYLVSCYDVEEYADRLEHLMASVEDRIGMSSASLEKAQDFSEEAIYLLWKNLLSECIKDGVCRVVA